MGEPEKPVTTPDHAASTAEGVELIKTLALVVEAGFKRMDETLAKLSDRADVSEMKIGDMETWRARNSDRVGKLAATTSSNDLTQDAKIAAVITDVATIKSQNVAQMVILNRLDKICRNPNVKRLGWLAVACATGWLMLHMSPAQQQSPPQPVPQVTSK